MVSLFVRKLVVLCVVATTSGFQATAFAWGDRGHRIIAAIAYERLVPEVRKEVDALLAEDKDKLTAPDFISRATWADKLLLDRETTKSGYNATRFWHFAEFELNGGTLFRACYGLRPLPPGIAASRGPAKDCVLNKVEQFAAELGHPKVDRKEKILALKFLINLVGEMHQPLNVASNDDLSGRSINIHSADPKKPALDLYAYWNTELVDRALGPGESDKLAAGRIASAFPMEQVGAALEGGPRTWILETVSVARNVVYDFSGQQRAQARDSFRGSELHVDYFYEARALPVTSGQLAKAGFRLARLLNEALAPDKPDLRQ